MGGSGWVGVKSTCKIPSFHVPLPKPHLILANFVPRVFHLPINLGGTLGGTLGGGNEVGVRQEFNKMADEVTLASNYQ